MPKMEAQYIIIFAKIKCILEQVRDCQDFRTLFRYVNRMFKMGARFAVRRDDCPMIFLGHDFKCPHVDHGFDAKNHTRLQPRSCSGPAEIRHLRLFVKFPADPVADQFSDHCKSMFFNMSLDRGRNVMNSITHSRLLDSLIKRLPSYLQKAFFIVTDLSDRKCDRGIAVITVFNYADIDPDGHPLFQNDIGRRNAMNDDIIDGQTGTGRISAIPFECRLTSPVFDERVDFPIQFRRRNAGTHQLAGMAQTIGDDATGLAYFFNFLNGSEMNHA